MISIKNIEKYYNKGSKNGQHALKDVSLDFAETGLVCILGESGSGKTTLLNVIGGLDDFESGSITVGDVTVDGYRPKIMEPVRNDRFGFVFQNYYLLSDYSVAYNVKIALNCYDMSEEEKDRRVDYVLKMLGIAKYKKKKVNCLSGGQQQRVSIARVLVKAPDVIFADEPTGNLDEENTIRTMSILKNISKECLVLLVTHEKRIARFFADRIIEIRDGQVVKDEDNKALSAYERSDDPNIYLPEYEEQTLTASYGEFRLYARGDEPVQPLKLNFVAKDGKLYIQNLTDLDIVVAGEESGVKILNEERAPLSNDDVENFDYSLSKPEGKKASKLPFREIKRMALENLKLMGRKQFFMIAVLLVTAVMLCLTMGEILSSVYFDKESVVSTDPHYVKVRFLNVSAIDESEQTAVLKYLWNGLDNSDYGELFFVPKINLYLVGRGYSQLENLKQQIKGFCYVDKKYFDETTLLYGSAPRYRDEAVVDIKIIEDLMDSGDVVSSMYENAEDFIGVTLATSLSGTSITITGICDCGLPNIYCGQTVLLSFDSFGYSVADFDEFKDQYPEYAPDTALAEDQMLMRSGRMGALNLSVGDTYYFGNDKTHVYTIVGMIPDDLGFDYVLSDTGCEYVRDVVIYRNKMAMIYTDDAQKLTDYIDSTAASALASGTETEITYPYEQEIAAYKAAIAGDFSAKKLITFVVAVIAVIMIYFSVKSNVYARSGELTVYRLIGISKGSITETYMLEMFLLTSFTTLPAALLTWAVINVLDGIPGIETGLILPFRYVLLLIAVVYCIHMIISILPVRTVLSKPPAALAAKE